jgi:hypothetical protein
MRGLGNSYIRHENGRNRDAGVEEVRPVHIRGVEMFILRSAAYSGREKS